MVKPYNYVRFRWWGGIDLHQISKELRNAFTVELHESPSDERDLAIYRDDRDELQVTANTLIALLSRSRAVLYQKEAAPFTPKDMMLRAKVFELYPRSRSTPFPLLFSHEPRFKVTKT